ncbi:MAG: hypothetical protein JWQ70_3150 [Aeromicrobium sp.]|nr:hypothetical protein [Aeromicrobium sp.]
MANGAGSAQEVVSAQDFVDLVRLSTEWAWLVDHRGADRAFELFTDDACLELTGQTLAGRSAIAEWGIVRAASTRLSRHVISNHRFDYCGPNEVEGTALVMSISDTLSARPDSNVDTRKPVVIGEYHDRYLRLDRRWLISARRFEVQFQGWLGSAVPNVADLEDSLSG